VGATDVLAMLAGFVLLVVGGEVLVRGASAVARAVGLSPLVVGLTVVSFATSAPELAVSLDAAASGAPGLVIGNVVGSNIANVLLVLGVAALLAPMVVRSRVVRLDVPVMIAVSVALLVLALDGSVSTLDGALLLAALVGYVAWSVVGSRREASRSSADSTQQEPDGSPGPVWRNLLLVGVGVGLLGLGAGWLVDGATTLAAAVGISDLVIGLTVVAIGTSLPELATSVIAAARGQRDLAVGNVVGSNVFNIGSVLGLTAVISPGGVPVQESAIVFDLPVMVAVAVALLPVAFTGLVVARWEGAVFVGYYLAYTGYLLLDASGHDALTRYGQVMLGFVVPLTVLTLAVVTIGEVRRRVAAQGSASAASP